MSPSGNPAHEEASRRALIAESKVINTKGHDVLDAQGRVVTIVAEITEHEETNPEQVRVPSTITTKYYVCLFGVVCVYFLDVLLFGATAEYVVGLITGNPMLVFVGKYGIPLFFLGIEVLCSLKMTEARAARENEEVPNYGW